MIKARPVGEHQLAQAGLGSEPTEPGPQLSAVALHPRGEMVIGRHLLTVAVSPVNVFARLGKDQLTYLEESVSRGFELPSTLPVHIHIGPGRCREIGVIDLSLLGDDQQISSVIAAALRSAADQMDRTTTVLAKVEDIVRTAADRG